MTYILSVVANPENPTIDSDLLDRIGDAVKGTPPRILAPNIAYDIGLAKPPAKEALSKAAAMAREVRVDINLISAENRRKKLLIADMDSTIIEQECIDEIADYAGKREEISDITERAMRGELDFDEALKARVAMLKDLSEEVLIEAFKHKISLTPGAKTLVQTMNAMDAMTALVSGGFTFFTSRVAKETGFKYNQANELLSNDGKLTGEVKTPILGRAAKEKALKRLADEANIKLADTIAVGDGANDLSMLGAAGVGVAFRAKPAVAAAAHARIDYADLTALLYLQGIPQTEFQH
ncbi:phosphoserine phosphatase SerB [Hyphococcus sp. DH-69]|uniref:phosphoserine phosphatase SerB n=1 Tax=Hyphococcus formosus TaxID=3143534 RepID=UPI00398A896A